MTITAAAELGPLGIRVNMVSRFSRLDSSIQLEVLHRYVQDVSNSFPLMREISTDHDQCFHSDRNQRHANDP